MSGPCGRAPGDRIDLDPEAAEAGLSRTDTSLFPNRGDGHPLLARDDRCLEPETARHEGPGPSWS